MTISNEEMCRLYADLSLLMRLGIALTVSLETIARECQSDRLRRAITHLHDSLKTGVALHRAMDDLPANFPPPVVGCIRLAEQRLILQEELALLEQAYHLGVLPNQKATVSNSLALWFAQLALLSSLQAAQSEADAFAMCSEMVSGSPDAAFADVAGDVAARLRQGEDRYQRPIKISNAWPRLVPSVACGVALRLWVKRSRAGNRSAEQCASTPAISPTASL